MGEELTIEPLGVSFSIPLTRFACSGHFVPNIREYCDMPPINE